MRVFLAEFVCGGGLQGTVGSDHQNLVAEGQAMLRAMAEDIAAVAELTVIVDDDLNLDLPSCEKKSCVRFEPMWSQWVRAAQGCDAAIIIAPETEGILAKAVGMLRAADVPVVASTGDFLRITSDKWLCAKHFAQAGVPHPLTWEASEVQRGLSLGSHGRLILKPRDGCGTQGVRLASDFQQAAAEANASDIVQTYISGTPASIALIVQQSNTTILPAVAQEIAIDNCAYCGGHGPLGPELQRRAMHLADQAMRAMPPTPRGFIGLDIVLGDSPADDVVIEVNSRLTTSYVGLRHIVKNNLAARILGLDESPIHCVAKPDSVHWTAVGEVRLDHQQVR